MTLLVTGASGFVGNRVCADAVQRDIQVRGAVRREDAVLPPGVERAVVKDMSVSVDWQRALIGVTSVIHLAARVHVMNECSPKALAEFRAVNVEGTRGLVRAAVAQGVERFVYVSSVKAHGEGGPEPYRPDDPLQPVDDYARSKAEAEAVVLNEGGSITCAVVRPPLVYGPGVGGNFLRLLRWTDVAARWPLPLGRIRNRRSLLFVGNLSDVLLHLATSPMQSGISGAWLVSDGEDLSTPELVERLGRAAGRPVRLVPCPEAVLRGVARLAGKAAEADRLLGSLTVDSTALRATGWTPPHSIDEGLRSTMAWWLGSRDGRV